MDTDRFWEVMETARIAAAGGDEPFGEALVRQLADRPEQEILEYAQRFEKAHDALYRWDVWARRPASSEEDARTTDSSTSVLA